MDLVTTNRADAEATANEDAHYRVERLITAWHGGAEVAARCMAQITGIETELDPEFGRRFVELIWVAEPDAMSDDYFTVREVLEGAGFPVARSA